MAILSRFDGFILYAKLGVDYFSTCELLHPNLKIRLRLTRARPNFYTTSETDNTSVSLRNVDCSLYTGRIALKDEDQKKRRDVLADNPGEFYKLETQAKTFIIPARQNQFIHEDIFNNALVRRISVAMNTNSPSAGSYTENPFRYQKLDLRQIRIHRGGQLYVDIDAVDYCRLYVTTLKAINLQGVIYSILIENSENQYVLAFDLTWMQDTTEICRYSELVVEPLRLELIFTYPLEPVTEFIALGERMFSIALEKLSVVGKNI